VGDGPPETDALPRANRAARHEKEPVGPCLGCWRSPRVKTVRHEVYRA
jgi:hypothetical protein